MRARRRSSVGGSRARRAIPYALAALVSLALIALVLGSASGTRRSVAPAPPGAGEARTAQRAQGEGGLRACGVECDPIDPRYLTSLPFGASSFWIQPWRAYLDTWPASRLLDAVGVNFNVDGAQAPDVARLLSAVGFRLARIEIGWGALSYEHPTTFVHEAEIRTRLMALRERGLRPLILLNADSGQPAPAKRIELRTLAPAPAGATTVTLDSASAAAVVAGKTGFDAVVFKAGGETHRHARRKRSRSAPRLSAAQRRARHEARRAERKAASEAGLTETIRQANPGLLITKVAAGGVASLSHPLPSALAPGAHRASTLLYAPFGAPRLPGGSPNPSFRATLAGWLSYVSTVSRLARGIFGAGGYDLEVWNELSFASQFLDVQKYYASSPGASSKALAKEVTKALLAETLAFVRDPANGISRAVGVSDGFASESPFPSAAYAPAGLTAYSKHPYSGPKSYPGDFHAKAGNVPRDALGRRDTVGSRHSPQALLPRFVPRYQSDFPEHTLSATSTETLIRDLAPITTFIYHAPHGRYVARAGQRAPQVWVTEYGLGTAAGTPVGPDEATPQTGSSATITSADRAHFQAKVVLRSLVSMVGKGVAREYFYAAAHAGDLSLVSDSFMSKVEASPGVYPGDGAGGETMSALHNLLSRFQGPGPTNGNAQQLTLRSITQTGNHAQFTGDASNAHPSLYDRDVLAVLPFQTSPTSFVIPVYVMTRDLLTLYEPAAPNTDIHRFDLPNETFRITLANLPQTSTPPTVTSYDPLHNENTPAHLVSREGSQATFELTATDYPRLLTLNYSGVRAQ